MNASQAEQQWQNCSAEILLKNIFPFFPIEIHQLLLHSAQCICRLLTSQFPLAVNVVKERYGIKSPNLNLRDIFMPFLIKCKMKKLCANHIIVDAQMCNLLR